MQSTESLIALRGPVALVHLLLRQFIQPGDKAVDATCGNGKDTLLLAELVGANGVVTAFDIQKSALDRTATRLAEAGFSDRARLLAVGHEQIDKHITSPIAAVVFNLGWLPGADREVMTRPDTTLPALNSTLELLKPGGMLTITCYPGHDGGDIETAAVLTWSKDLPANRFHVWRMGQLNVVDSAPFCLIIQKAPHAA